MSFGQKRIQLVSMLKNSVFSTLGAKNLLLNAIHDYLGWTIRCSIVSQRTSSWITLSNSGSIKFRCYKESVLKKLVVKFLVEDFVLNAFFAKKFGRNDSSSFSQFFDHFKFSIYIICLSNLEKIPSWQAICWDEYKMRNWTLNM